MVENFEKIKDVLALAVKLENLCEGFDITNKSAVLTYKIKVLLELSRVKFATPGTLMANVGIAKSNLAILCNKLIDEQLVSKTKDNIDAREICFSITDQGKKVLNTYLSKAKKNFESQLAYKNNIKQVNQSVKDLLELVK